MKVLYELDLNDIIRIVADKYGVPQEKVKKTNKDGLNYLMIDMSDTETPEPLTVKVTAEDIKRFIDKEAEEVKPVRYEDPDEAAYNYFCDYE